MTTFVAHRPSQMSILLDRVPSRTVKSSRVGWSSTSYHLALSQLGFRELEGRMVDMDKLLLLLLIGAEWMVVVIVVVAI